MLRPRLSLAAAAAVLPIVACASAHSVNVPAGAPATVAAPAKQAPALVARDTTRDLTLERRVNRLEMRLLERDAEIDDLEGRLDEARSEVVRALARLQTIANRAEAASGIAEAEIALQTLKSGLGPSRAAEAAPIAALVKESSIEFDKQNYAGALYLVGQAKVLAAASRGRLGAGERTPARAGETPFALAIRLKTTSRGNVRGGPGTAFPIAFAVDQGRSLTGVSYVDDWIRVSDDAGRSGWIIRSLVALR